MPLVISLNLRFDLIHSVILLSSFNLGGNGGAAGFEPGYTDEVPGGSSYDTTLPSVDLQPGSGGGGGSGSGGSYAGGKGGAGGAAIRLFAVDTIKIDGSILSNGQNGEGCASSDSTW